eukprot:1188494-Prorocentrum_minimum.AAC.1
MSLTSYLLFHIRLDLSLYHVGWLQTVCACGLHRARQVATVSSTCPSLLALSTRPTGRTPTMTWRCYGTCVCLSFPVTVTASGCNYGDNRAR